MSLCCSRSATLPRSSGSRALFGDRRPRRSPLAIHNPHSIPQSPNHSSIDDRQSSINPPNQQSTNRQFPTLRSSSTIDRKSLICVPSPSSDEVRIGRELATRLYTQSRASRWAVEQPSFTEWLERSAGKAF